jgi:hypothetical protein
MVSVPPGSADQRILYRFGKNGQFWVFLVWWVSLRQNLFVELVLVLFAYLPSIDHLVVAEFDDAGIPLKIPR